MSAPTGHDLRRRRALRAAAGAIVTAALCVDAAGLINPRFTPIHLVNDSRAIVVVRLVRGADRWKIEAAEALKGRAPKGRVLDLSACKPEQLRQVRALLAANGRAAAVLFVAAGKAETKAYLSVAGTWLSAAGRGGAGWQVRSIAAGMSGVYAGGTDMLIRMVRYILAWPDADVPTSVGACWARYPCRVGRLAGGVKGMQAVRIGGDGRTYLFVAAGAGGDRLYRAARDDEAFEDVTAAVGLTSRSRSFCWADVSADARLELISWDGAAIRVYAVGPGGTFAPAETVGAWDPNAACLALSACSLPPDGAPGIVASTAGPPVVLRRGRSGTWRAAAPPRGELLARAGEAASACVVADLDNDGHWDVLQPRRKAGALWKGGSAGLARPVASPVACADPPGRVALGDFNHDGFLDVFVGGAKANQLWENDGKGGFAGVADRAGSLSYKAIAGFSACRAADLNHDGRTDLCLLHAREAFTYHFNRGFRCFGEEGGLRLPAPPAGADAPGGQHACAVADFNGDGSLDLAVGLADGSVRCFYNDAFNQPLIRVRLAKSVPGPVTVGLWQGDKLPLCLGAAPLCGRGPEATFTLGRQRGFSLRWSQPGRPNRVRNVAMSRKLLDARAEIVLGP